MKLLKPTNAFSQLPRAKAGTTALFNTGETKKNGHGRRAEKTFAHLQKKSPRHSIAKKSNAG